MGNGRREVAILAVLVRKGFSEEVTYIKVVNKGTRGKPFEEVIGIVLQAGDWQVAEVKTSLVCSGNHEMACVAAAD